jgi:hypothetical protein
VVVVRRLRGEAPRGAAAWVSGLSELRHARGHLLTLKEMRYADADRIDELAAQDADLVSFGQRAVAFLAREDSFAEHHTDVEQLAADAESIGSVAEAEPVAARLRYLADTLRTLTEVVASVDIDDATVRTSVLERIAEVLGGVNRARALLDTRCRTLRDSEGRAEFAAEFALLGQAVTGALAAAVSPAACDEQLASALVRLENLESRFAEFDDFLGNLANKRTEVYEAFSTRKQSLLDACAGRAEQLAASAARVLEAIARRAATLADADAVAADFASDPMVAKVRRAVDELRELGNPVLAEELDGRLRSARQAAARAARPCRPVRRRRPHPSPGRPPFRSHHPTPRPHPGPARRRPRRRPHRHGLPRPGHRPGLRRHSPLLGPSPAVGVARGLPRRTPRRPPADRTRIHSPVTKGSALFCGTVHPEPEVPVLARMLVRLGRGRRRRVVGAVRAGRVGRGAADCEPAGEDDPGHRGPAPAEPLLAHHRVVLSLEGRPAFLGIDSRGP